MLGLIHPVGSTWFLTLKCKRGKQGSFISLKTKANTNRKVSVSNKVEVWLTQQAKLLETRG